MGAVVGLLAVLAVRAEAAPLEGGRPDAAGYDDRVRGDVDDRVRDDIDDDIAVETPYPAGSFAPDELCDCDAPALARIAATAPPLSAIIARAHEVAGLARRDDPTHGWQTRSRWSSLIPWLSVRGGTSQSWRDVIDPGLAAASASAPTSLNHGLTYDIRLSWHLEHLLYDPNEPRFTSFELALRRNRRKLAIVASRAYYGWLRASVAVERDARWQLRLDEAGSELDALTDGWFSEALEPRPPPDAIGDAPRHSR